MDLCIRVCKSLLRRQPVSASAACYALSEVEDLVFGLLVVRDYTLVHARLRTNKNRHTQALALGAFGPI